MSDWRFEYPRGAAPIRRVNEDAELLAAESQPTSISNPYDLTSPVNCSTDGNSAVTMREGSITAQGIRYVDLFFQISFVITAEDTLTTFTTPVLVNERFRPTASVLAFSIVNTRGAAGSTGCTVTANTDGTISVLFISPTGSDDSEAFIQVPLAFTINEN